jgi:hypothetical protein
VLITVFTKPEHLSPPYPYTLSPIAAFFVIDESMNYTLTNEITASNDIVP